MRNFFCILTILLSVHSFAAVRTTVQPGDFSDPNTWDCNCFPITTDDIIVQHPITQWWNIQLDNITITSTVSTWFITRYSDKTVLAGTDLNFSTGYGLYMWTGTGSIFNHGNIRMNWLGGINAANWVNQESSKLEVRQYFFGNYSVFASATDNEVIWSGQNQNIGIPVNREFYNLTFRSTDIGFTKFLSSDIVILNDLNIENCELDANNFNIEIFGNWTDTDGRFDATSTRVTFSGVDQELYASSGLERFNDLDFSSSSSLKLKTGMRVDGTINIATLFEAQGNQMDVYGNWFNNGTFVHGNNMVRMRGNTATTISGNNEFFVLRIVKGSSNCTNNGNINIRSTLRLRTGGFNTNGNVTLLSDINGTARLDRVFTGTMTGDITVQRYLATNSNDWHLIGSPIAGMKLSDWNDDLLTTGFTGSDFPTFNFINATYYDETFLGHKDIGLLDAGNISDDILVGQGWRFYLPADVTTIDVKGPANMGNVSIPVTYTGSGSVWDDGWNLVANPYASTIDWSKGAGWTKSGLNDAIYVWNPANSQYTTYVGGVGTNGGSRYIPSTQAFWVHANSAGPSLDIAEEAKSVNDPAFKEIQTSADYFKMIVRSEYNFTDELAIKTTPLATDNFDPMYDALEISSATLGAPSICALDNEDLAYSIFSFSHNGEERMLPLKLTITYPGVHTFSFDNLYQYRDYSCLSLYDAETGETHILKPTSEFTFTFEAMEYANRFYIIMCPPLGSINNAVKSVKKEDALEISVLPGYDILKVTFNDNKSSSFEVSINDMLGRKLYGEIVQLEEQHSFDVTRNDLNGIILLSVRDLETNETKTKRIVLN